MENIRCMNYSLISPGIRKRMKKFRQEFMYFIQTGKENNKNLDAN